MKTFYESNGYFCLHWRLLRDYAQNHMMTSFIITKFGILFHIWALNFCLFAYILPDSAF